VIGAGTAESLAGEDIRKLMAGGAEMADLEQELENIT
jgi:simple sugar transport system ATP-binding protein